MKACDKLKVIIGAGGSGGHLFPAQQLSRKLFSDEVFFVGHGLGKSPFFEKEKIPFLEISAAPFTEPFRFLKNTLQGLWQSFRFIQRFQPDVVVGFGSYHSLPLLLAAFFLRKKIVLFEANCTPGKVNLLFRPVAHAFAVQFAQKAGTLVPLLPWSAVLPTYSQTEARRSFGLKEDVLTVLVFGGSQGASFLNEIFPKVADALNRECQILHFTGKGAASYSRNAIVKTFEPDMAKAYAAADLVVCRSGAGTVAELIQFQKPALLIPYPYAGGHQVDNAKFLAQYGAEMVLQKEASVEKMVQAIDRLLENSGKIQVQLKHLKEGSSRIDLAALVRQIGGKSCSTI